MKRLIVFMMLCIALLLFEAAQADVLTFPDHLKTIEDEAFQNDESIDEVVLPEGLTSIGKNAFANTGLRRIYLPDTLESIGEGAFSGCTDMTAWGSPDIWAENWCLENGIRYEPKSNPPEEFTFSYPSDREAIVTGWNGNSTKLYIPAMADADHVVTSVGNGAFRGKTGLVKVNLPAGVSTIGSNAFNGCTSLRDIRLPDGLTVIGAQAFDNCISLSSVLLPVGLTSVKDAAFRNCTSLTAALLPDTVTSIGGYAFENCAALESFHYPYQLQSAGMGMLRGCTKITSVTVPEGITALPNAVFMNCDQIQEVILPSTLTATSLNSFSGCTSLAIIQLPAGVTTIGRNTFGGCTSLTDIQLPAGLTVIDSQAFDNCSSLLSILLPDGLTSVKDAAFRNCTSLTAALLPDTVTSIGGYAFENCAALESFHYPYQLQSAGLGMLRGCTKITSVTVPEGITTLPRGVFMNCDQIREAILPSTLADISANAFNGCTSLEEIQLPAGLTVIDAQAFDNCTNLSSILLPDGLISVKNAAFRNCTSLTAALLPDTVTSIGGYAFENCAALEWIYVPVSVETFGLGVFNKCPAVTVETEHGADAVSYCISNNYSYYYLTPIGMVYPTDHIYQGSTYTLYGTVCSNIALTDVSAVLFDSFGNEIRSFSIDPGTNRYLVSGELSDTMSLGTLPLGVYRLVIDGATARSEERFTDSTFEVTEQPLTVSLSGCEIDTFVIQNRKISMSGTLEANYPITKVTVTLTQLSRNAVVQKVDLDCGAAYCYLDGVASHLNELTETGEYLLNIQITGHGESVTAYSGFVECQSEVAVSIRRADPRFSQSINANLDELEEMSAEFCYNLNNAYGNAGALMENKYEFLDSERGGNYTSGRSWLMWKEIGNDDGSYTRVYAVGIEGSKTASQWENNFDVGSGSFHAGFYSLASNTYDELMEYRADIEKNYPRPEGDHYTPDKYYICGHSRGAAAANIIGGYLLPKDGISAGNIYCFCFACPNVTKNEAGASYVRVYNIVSDLVPRLPLGTWGYQRYGTVKTYNNNGIIGLNGRSILLTTPSFADDMIYVLNSVTDDSRDEALAAIRALIRHDNLTDALEVYKGMITVFNNCTYDWIPAKMARRLKYASLFAEVIDRGFTIIDTHAMSTYLAWIRNY